MLRIPLWNFFLLKIDYFNRAPWSCGQTHQAEVLDWEVKGSYLGGGQTIDFSVLIYNKDTDYPNLKNENSSQWCIQVQKNQISYF